MAASTYLALLSRASPQTGGSSTSKNWSIIAIAIGAVCVAALAVSVVILTIRHRKRSSAAYSQTFPLPDLEKEVADRPSSESTASSTAGKRGNLKISRPIQPPPAIQVQRPSVVESLLSHLRPATHHGRYAAMDPQPHDASLEQQTRSPNPWSPNDYPQSPYSPNRWSLDSGSPTEEGRGEGELDEAGPVPRVPSPAALPTPPVIEGVSTVQGAGELPAKKPAEDPISFRQSMFAHPKAERGRPESAVDGRDPLDREIERVRDGFRNLVMRPQSHHTINGVRTYELD